jgi:hypothetical protein
MEKSIVVLGLLICIAGRFSPVQADDLENLAGNETHAATNTTLSKASQDSQGKNSVSGVIADIKSAYRVLNDLELFDEVEFTTQTGRRKFERVLFRMRTAIKAMKDWDEGEAPGLENFRGRATVHIHENLSSGWAREAVKALPKFVGEGDLLAVKAIVEQMSSGFVSNYLKAYFTHTLTQPKRHNKKGEAGAAIVVEVSTGWSEAALKVLPGYLSADDLAAVKSILDRTNSGTVTQALKDYFQ